MNINLTMIGQLIMFAMFTWFCMKFIWPPIVAAMDERKKRIESGLIAAERGLSEHKEAQQKAQEMINQSKDQQWLKTLKMLPLKKQTVLKPTHKWRLSKKPIVHAMS
jgi:F0F1-type ATP synthase membrane subunit b/b'